ncbi:MAG: serine--tRNA ligase [Bacteroidetes bacterium]|nr:serine--tRNA ligase [Bacteroidota bacterium]
MLQVSQIRENKDLHVVGLSKRGISNVGEILEEIVSVDDQRKSTQTELDSILAENNILAKSIGQLMKEGRLEEVQQVKVKTGELKERSKLLSENLSGITSDLQQKLYQIPNIPHSSVPNGKNAEDNEIVYQVDNLPDLGSDAAPHWELIKKYDIIDFDLGNKISGAGFPVYKGKGARLQRAMVNFFLDQALENGYTEIQPPVVVNEASGYGTGQLPDKEGQMYQLNDTDLYLIPTAEVPLTNLYRDVILKESELPIKNVGFTPCFRREAGSWGAHVRGLNRLHQFDKVEIVHVEHPSKSYDTLEKMASYIEGLIKLLELPYRKLRLCGGDMSFTSALTYDFEVFSAAQKKWLEVSSVSNFEAYQANRLKLRYKDADGKTQLLHTLNGSALALPRILAAVLENNQTKDSINIPKALWDYTGFKTIP